MSVERMRILKMLEQGKVSAKEAAELLSAVEKPKAETRLDSLRGRWMRVRVSEIGSNRDKVNVNVPLGMVDVALRMGARFVPKTSDFDPQKLLAAIQSGERGIVLEYENLEDSERVEVFIE